LGASLNFYIKQSPNHDVYPQAHNLAASPDSSGYPYLRKADETQLLEVSLVSNPSSALVE